MAPTPSLLCLCVFLPIAGFCLISYSSLFVKSSVHSTKLKEKVYINTHTRLHMHTHMQFIILVHLNWTRRDTLFMTLRKY